MIQDIKPKQFYNQWAVRTPQPEDTAICFQGSQLWLTPEGGYPTCGDFFDLPEVEYRYLFSVSREHFFLVLAAEPAPNGLELRPFSAVRDMQPMDRAMAGFTAKHLADWYRDNRFCGRCGYPTQPGPDERKLCCPACGNAVYPRINPAIIAAVTDGDRLLMTQYAGRAVTRYVLVAGFTEIGETAEETVAREVLEEVGVRVKNIRYYKSQPWGVSGNLTLGYVCQLDGDDALSVDKAELSTARWFHRSQVPVPTDETALTSEMVRAFAEGRL